MSDSQINMEAFGILLQAIRDYRDKLDVNRGRLQAAANICDQAMGSDPIVTKKIAKLEEALCTLDFTCNAVEEAAEEVVRKHAQAETIIEEA